MSTRDKSDIPYTPHSAPDSRVDLVDVSVVQNQPSSSMISKITNVESSNGSTQTSEISSSDQTSSEDLCTESSETTSNSASDSGSSSDSDSSGNDENTTSDSDDESSEEESESDSSTDTEKIPNEITHPWKDLSSLQIEELSSETIPPKSSVPSDDVVKTLMPNVESVHTVGHDVPQMTNCNDMKATRSRSVITSGNNSTRSDSSRFHNSSPIVEHTTITKVNPPSDIKSPRKLDSIQITKDMSDSPSHAKSDTSSDNIVLPPELAGGWGEEPEPASWDWQGMPFDYMGILEEQRRTVFYEFHEHNGKGEWKLPKNKGANFPSNVSNCRSTIGIWKRGRRL
jgi:hypothetical protein